MGDLTAVPDTPIVVGISVSEPDVNELVQLGLSELHVRDAFIEIVRHILARGWSIAYGGDLRRAGYTQELFDLARTYDRRDIGGPERLLSFLAWPIWQELTAEDRAGLANIATLREVARPQGSPLDLTPWPDRSPDELLWGSLALTAMRQEMTASIHARVVVGGRLWGQQGLYPGVAEESLLTLRAGLPLYVAGGFGGCGRAIASALVGNTPDELTLDYQLEHTPSYSDLINAATAKGHRPSFEEMNQSFAGAGIGGLNNGLSDNENARLFVTDDVDEVLALILTGLRHLFDAG